MHKVDFGKVLNHFRRAIAGAVGDEQQRQLGFGIMQLEGVLDFGHHDVGFVIGCYNQRQRRVAARRHGWGGSFPFDQTPEPNQAEKHQAIADIGVNNNKG